MDIPDPPPITIKLVFTIVVIVLIVSAAGPALSEAKQAVTFDLLGVCVETVFQGDLAGILGGLSVCALAGLVYLVIPGMIGLAIMLWRRSN